ncbi:hypothetical protein G7046_g1953 [Stylonectria norvegica]|nr:hypothetical protein G7046_g1953 [Stylonectria norvegica]
MLPTQNETYRLRRLLLLLLVIFLVNLLTLLATDAISLASRSPPCPTLAPLNTTVSFTTPSVFIASLHRNDVSLLAATWSDALLHLVDHLGPQNVFVSAADCASTDGTNLELLALKERLDARGVGNVFHLGAVDWRFIQQIDGARGTDADRPLDMADLAQLRNQVMEPLAGLVRGGRRFDAVLWIDDDIVFDTQDVMSLLGTHNASYAAACSTTFTHHGHAFNPLALRDDQGEPPASAIFPWFRSPTSRTAALAGSPIPVSSCWDGLVALDATPFYSEPALRFRTIDDRLAARGLSASEACLIHADNYLSGDRGVWVNPNVRVAHNAREYRAAKGTPFPSGTAAVVAAWANRAARWTGTLRLAWEKERAMSRLRKWTAEVPKGDLVRYEPGEFCLVDETEIVQHPRLDR